MSSGDDELVERSIDLEALARGVWIIVAVTHETSGRQRLHSFDAATNTWRHYYPEGVR